MDELGRKMGEESAEKRLEAVRDLGRIRDTKAVELLIQAIGDSDLRVRVKAVEMLGELRSLDAAPVLVQHLFLRSTEVPMKQRILATLGKIADPRSARPILEFLQRDLDTATRGTAVYALGEIGAPEAVETLERIATEDEDASVRRLAGDAARRVQYHQASRSKEAKGPAETFLPPTPAPPGR